MLKLKRLELQGFKSFCDRTELKFNGGGIAAVVGPNGCGKSNLSDAISWVLGEQSAKSLRGARMEDVIFAGTRDRKPVGMAAVTMTLAGTGGLELAGRDNLVVHANGHSNGVSAPNARALSPEEITITRRLFRSGESEYLIDGRLARLRDIQDLFMGTGLGPESYAIIEQGRIGQILSSKPQDRRSIIEEAAGVTKFKTRKRLAEAKLESAKQNLSRVFDILEEVTRQVNSLKRQASKTRRYGELKSEMEARLRLLLAGRYRLLERDAAKTALDLNLATAALRQLSEEIAGREQERASLQAVAYENEAQLTAARRQLAEFQVELERARGRLEGQVRENAAIEERMAQGERDSEELAARSVELDAERSQQALSLAEMERRIEDRRALALEKNQTREALQARLQEQEESLETGRVALLRLLGETAALKNQLAQIDEYLAGMERETARVRKEEESAAAELERLSAARKNISISMAQRQMELETVSGERRKTEEDLSAQKQTGAEVRSRVDELRAECSRLQARRTSLDDILTHRAYTTEAVKRIFQQRPQQRPQETPQESDVQARSFRPIGVLADFVEVDATFERAAEEFLHDELEYVVVQSWEEAGHAVDFLRSGSEGRATFLVHRAPEGGTPAGFPAPDLDRLGNHLRLTNGLAGQAADLLPRLDRCYLAPDRASAESLAAQFPELYFLLSDGLCYHGRTLSGGKKTASGPLALKRELRELAVTLESHERELALQVELSADIDREIDLLEKELERLRGLQQSQEKDALALDHEMRKLTEETARANSHLSVARLELQRLRQERARTIDQREKNTVAVDEKEATRRDREASLDAEREALEHLETEAANIAEEHAALRVELAGLEERHRAQRAALARVEAQWREITARGRQLGAEMERLGAEGSRLLSDNIELDRKAAELTTQIVETNEAVDRLAAEESRIRETLARAEEDLRQRREQVEMAHHTRSDIEIDLVKKQADLKYLDETSRKELNCPVEELAQPEETALDPEAIAEAERAYEEIRSRIEALGPINPQALEEFQESQQRHDFLSAQRQDLLDSIRDTEKAIREIDEVSHQKFSEAFDAINANFRQAFQTLFGGGSGEMRLTDETNASDSGIEIVASPPGKKLQNVLLLSGGEKALAALALLMAIFRYQPSPFCILDEVDAPLDEPNIERLTRLLCEMSVDTQFILITHSKKTMESAQSLYGVTMQEPGISKLVSVKFHPVVLSAAS